MQTGDTLGSIAALYGTTIQDLVRYNQLDNPNRLAVGQELVIPPAKGIAESYQVRKGDVLSKIAARYGLTVQDLVIFNKLSSADSLTVGQELLIPKGSVSGSIAAATPALPSSLVRELDRIKVNRSKWKYIVVHHSATDRGSAKSMDRYHREERHMENGLAYHFVIGNGKGSSDGLIEIGSRWRRQIKGGHVASTALNEKSIGICLVGNFEKYAPSARQMESLRALNHYLVNRCGLAQSTIRPHRKINPKPTKCPGKHFPDHEMY